MSITDVTARIQQIQGQLAMLNPPTAPARGSSAGFATTMARLTPSTGATGPDALVGAGDLAATGSDAGAAVVEQARRYLGVPYVWGGTNPATGLDCSGLVRLVYGKFGIDLPRVSSDQARAGVAVPSLAQARPGDIVAFGHPVHHVGIYAGDGKMIEAPHPGANVRLAEIIETPSAIRRVLPDLSAMSRVMPGQTPYAAEFTSAAQRYGVPASLLAAVAHQESGFNPGAVSPAGARGLMQLMPATAAGLGVDPLNPSQAVDGAARLLRDLIAQFGRTDLALAAYNAGPGAVHRYHGIPPYPETQRYVPAVLAYQSTLEVA